MLLIIEIMLTISACNAYAKAKQNWAKGLIPLGVVFLGGIFLGYFLALVGVTTAVATGIGVILDLGLIIYLGYISATVKPVV